jgi:hypothetical protein
MGNVDNNILGRSKNIKNIIAVVAIFIIAVLVTGRIIYINSGIFPSTKINIVSRSEGIKNDTNNIYVKSCKQYSSSEWAEYLEENNIVSEEKFIEEHKNYAFASKQPDDDYYIIVLDAEVENTTQEDQKFNMTTGISLTDGIYSNAFSKHIYYSSVLNGNTDGKMATVDIKPHEKREVKCAYISKIKYTKCAIENFKMGNYQKMNITIDSK